MLLLDTYLTQSVVRHEGQEGGQFGELEPHEGVLQENVETIVVNVALEGCRSCSEGD